MKLYLAWVNWEWNFYDLVKLLNHRSFLGSYYYMWERWIQFIEKAKSEWFDIFLDSGAFSSDTIEINWYVDYLKKTWKNLSICANMDTWDWAQQLSHLWKIEASWVKNVLPVYHIIEWKEWKLDELDKIFENYDYFAVWGIANSIPRKDEFVAYVFSRWNYYRQKQWYPTKIHWFGVTSEKICLSYPFYSVDSTSWLAASRFWGILVFNEKTKKIEKVHCRDIQWISKVWNRLPIEYRDIDVISDTTNKKWKPYMARNFLWWLAYIQFYEYVKSVWEKRGLKW